jgi:hypothetical protein
MNITNTWKKGMFPIINGITYPDGCVEQIDFLTDGKTKKSFVKQKIHINDLDDDIEFNINF